MEPFWSAVALRLALAGGAGRVPAVRVWSDDFMPRPKKKLSLNTIVREFILINRYRDRQHNGVIDVDWAGINYNRTAVVNRLMAPTPDGDYLEIGCAGNDLFDSVMAGRKVGVDPARGGTHRMTSDAFFADYAGPPFDVVFIDGLHVYEQVRRDLDGALRVLKPGGWVAIHDMMPRDWLEEHVPQIRTRGWTGDGWKVAFELLAAPDMEFRLLMIDHGVLVAHARVANPTIPDLSATLAPARFGYLHEHFALLPTVGYDTAAAWIAGCGNRAFGDPAGGAV
jgi:SAM-dependent methyltransferase